MHQEKRQKIGLQAEVDAAIIQAAGGFVHVAEQKLRRCGFNGEEVHRLLEDPSHRRTSINTFLTANNCQLVHVEP